jgi:murein DD-endopeptidase MepM/ murein hydrolase activator NlpD
MSQFQRAKKFFDKWFPERQIYHRSGGTVRYISLSPSQQTIMALAAVGVVGWCAYASVNVIFGNQMRSAEESEKLQLEAKYKRWIQEARARQETAEATQREQAANFEKAIQEVERRHATLKLLLDYAGGSSISATARPIERDGARLLMQTSIEEADPRQSRPWAESEGPYTIQTARFSARIDRLKDDQTAFLMSAEEAAVARSEQIKGVLTMTGIGFARLTGEDGAAEMGGPLVPLDLSAIMGDGEINPAFAKRVEQVAARVAEARRLDGIAAATPLAPPVAVEYRQTSGFGPRFDPVSGRPAFHAGLDLAAFQRAPVVATSPGTVAYAGPKAGYGNVVEIDHGHGFKTRYGHLDDFQVKRGDRVAIGQRIGSMGNTGRSTGTHLHYEVWFRGKVYDPVDFLRAGRHVHEQG